MPTDAVGAALAAVRRAVEHERHEQCQAAFHVGFDKGWHAGYEAAEAGTE